MVGGGAAGIFAAITAAEAAPDRKVIVLEKSPSLLAKVRISGGGRCNVTHACFEPKQLAKNYPRGSRELLGPFHRWQPRDTVEWFQSRGVPLKTEPDGRMFPTTDSSQTIIDCLLDSARRAGVEIRTGIGLADVQPSPIAGEAPGTFALKLSDGTGLACDRLLLATGGLKPGPTLDLIRSLGHTVAPLAPSLFTFHVKDPRIEGLAGLSVGQAIATIPGTHFEHAGPVLVTHWGLSGPAILKLSAWAARWAQDHEYRFTVRVNWTGLGAAEVQEKFEGARAAQAVKAVRNTPLFDLPGRLWLQLIAAAGLADATKWSHLRKDQALALQQQLTACDLQVTGKSMFKEEFVTCGGVELKEIHFKTMESRLVPGLHFAGEVLDIDGITGGFNFQAAWTTGRLAGLAMAEVE